MQLRRILGVSLVLVVVLSLLPVSIASGAVRADEVVLNPVGSSGISGLIAVTVVTGPGGGTTLTLSVDSTVAGHTYWLYLGRDRQGSFELIRNVFHFEGTGNAMTITGIPMDKAPTNGTLFELSDVYSTDPYSPPAGIVAISDPIKY